MKLLKRIKSWGKYLGNERGAISLGGAAAPAATPIVANPNIRQFNVTCLVADTGPTAFNHGLQAVSANDVFCILMPQVTLAAAAAAFWGATWTATQVSLSKQGSAGSGGAVPGTTVVAILLCWNTHTAIR